MHLMFQFMSFCIATIWQIKLKIILNKFMSLDRQIQVEKVQGSPRKKNKQKSKQDIFQHLLSLYQPNRNAIKQTEVPHAVQDLYELLSTHPKNRSIKAIKKIKAQLNEMKCFKVPPFNQQNPEFNEIFKRDNANILTMISPFVEMTKYGKGSIIQVTALKRETIKILLLGEVAIFQPINQKSFKNCKLKLKNREVNLSMIENSHNIIDEFFAFNNRQKPEDKIIYDKERQQFDKMSTLGKSTKQDQKIKLGEFYQLPEQQPVTSIIGESLTKQQCKLMLSKCNVISVQAPHKQGKQIGPGEFIFDRQQSMFVDQKDEYYQSTVCRTDCVFIEIGYQIAKQVIMLINSDRQRPYILSLLFIFPMLKYFQAKQYVTQEFMIAQQIQQQDGVKVTKKSAVPIIKQLKIISSLNFQLLFTGQLYLIISGQITLIIDKLSQRKSSTIEYNVPRKSAFNKQILHLYKNDIFGFEQIGRNKNANLRYMASMGSKLLKINKNVLNNHMQIIPGFKEIIQDMKKMRNDVVMQIVEKIEMNLEDQEIKRHQCITYTKSQSKLAKIKSTRSTQLTSDQKQIMQLKYLGHQQFESVSNKIKKHFSPQNTDIPKQGLSPEIVKQSGLGIEFSKNLLKRPSQNINIKDGWIQIRNSEGDLLRRKKVKQSDKQANTGRGDALLRRLGILNSKQIADHNHEIVKKRPSKYQFEDLQKQANQFKQIRQKVHSLPKITKFFAKKQDRLFSILYKRTHL